MEIEFSKKQEIVPYRSKQIRFFQLFLLAMVVFGNQYAFNNPQALEQSLKEDLDIGQTKFQLLYTIFAFPNIFATFIIGFLIDFLGVRTGIIALSAGVALFQLVIAIGGYQSSYSTILVGRMLFGLASQSLITAQASMVSLWFKGRELAFALGIAITFPQLGNALNSLVTPMVYDATKNLGAPLMLSVGICVVSLMCALGAAWLDRYADQMNDKHGIKVRNPDEEEGDGERINCQDIKSLKGSFWLLTVLCMFAVALYVPFLDNASSLLQNRFCFTQVTAGQALVVTYLVSATLSAPLGYLVDRVGYKRYFIIAAMFILTLPQVFFYYYPQCETEELKGSIFGLAFVGLGYCFYANCILPAIPLVVKQKVIGTAFGIMQMVQSIALSFFPLITGSIVQKAATPALGYKYSSLFFVTIGTMGFATSVCLLFISPKSKKKLDKVSKEKLIVESKEGISESEATSEDERGNRGSATNIRNGDNLNDRLLSGMDSQGRIGNSKL